MSELNPMERAMLRILRAGPLEVADDDRVAIYLVRSTYAVRQKDGRLAITPAGKLRIYEPRKPVDERRRHDNHEGE